MGRLIQNKEAIESRFPLESLSRDTRLTEQALCQAVLSLPPLVMCVCPPGMLQASHRVANIFFHFTPSTPPSDNYIETSVPDNRHDTPVTPHNLDTEACGQKTHSDRTIFLLPTLHPSPRNDPKTFSQNPIPITERDAAQSSYSRAGVSPDAAETRVLLQLTLDQKSI